MSEDPKSAPDARKDTRFKKGRSGNSRGRPRKPKEGLIPSQLRKDILHVMELPVVVKTPDGEKSLPVRQAFIYSVARRAIAGDKVSYVKMWGDLQRDAVQQNQFVHPDLEKSIELFNKHYCEGSNEPGLKETLDVLVKISKGLL